MARDIGEESTRGGNRPRLTQRIFPNVRIIPAPCRRSLQDRRWDRAAQLGEQIIDQFPNSRMAAEVRGLLDGVRARARQMPVSR